MAGDIQSVRVFAGTVEAGGLPVPASLTLIEHGAQYECRFVFFLGRPVAITVIAPRAGGESALRGTARDPRGWDVTFNAELTGDHISGSFTQPHDQGNFRLDAV